MIALLAGCALRHVAHYEPVAFDLAPYDPAITRWLAADLARCQERGAMGDVLLPDGSRVEDPALLPPQVVHAVWGTWRGWARGAELDLLVQGRPVTVWWSVDGEATVAWSDAPVSRGRSDRSPEALVAAYGIGGVADGDRAWTPAELAAVELALSLLRPDELVAVRGVRFVRRSRSTRSPQELAWFDPTTEPPTISLFDLAFDVERQGFVGPVDAPVAAGVASLLHEIGHALADSDARDAWLRLGQAPMEDAREARATYRALRRRGPRIEAWEAFRQGRPGPSSFGFRDPHESYAEAFALAHLDPDALERALPGAVAFFAEGAADTR